VRILRQRRRRLQLGRWQLGVAAGPQPQQRSRRLHLADLLRARRRQPGGRALFAPRVRGRQPHAQRKSLSRDARQRPRRRLHDPQESVPAHSVSATAQAAGAAGASDCAAGVRCHGGTLQHAHRFRLRALLLRGADVGCRRMQRVLLAWQQRQDAPVLEPH